MFDIKIQELDSVTRTNTGYFQQTPFWSYFKERHGWKFKAYNINGNEVCVLIRSFGHNLFSLAYIPLYPSLKDIKGSKDNTIEFCNYIEDVSMALKSYLPKNTICIRYDPAVGFSTPEERDEFVKGMKVVSFADHLKLHKNKVDIQPPDSTQIDLTSSEEEILGRMKNKWRYNVNLSSRKGVIVERFTGDDPNLDEKLDIFYELYKITSVRDGIALHPKSYYKDLLVSSSKDIKDGKDVPVISLYIAHHEEDNLGAIITLFSKTESIYLYGCSSNVKRNLMPNFLLQWTAMKDAKAYGSQYYDMYGMPPTDDPNHPMHGLYQFKTGFGGNNIHRIGSWDVRLKGIYRVLNSLEKLRAFYHKTILKKIRGR